MPINWRDAPTIIGITGGAGTGKSTVAYELVRLYGFTRLAFGDPLKAMLQVFLASYGMSASLIQRHIDGDLKEKPCPALDGATCRRALQTLGTEWGREYISRELWTHHLGQRIMALPPRTRVVIDDVRMNNEAEYLFNTFGLDVSIWKVEGKGIPQRNPGLHESERGIELGNITATLRHDYTMPSLHATLAAAMQAMGIERSGVWQS